MTAPPDEKLPADVLASLDRLGFVDASAPPRSTPLRGGVSSEIWRVEAKGRVVCVKRARARLAVAAIWEVPVERSRYEAEFLRVAERAAPDLSPRLLAEDADAGLIVLEYLDPRVWRGWKSALLEGRVDLRAAAGLGAALGGLVAKTLGCEDVARRFPTDPLFHAIRLEPYLVEAGRRNPALAGALQALVETTAAAKLALVHGDVSPKNILVRDDGAFRLLDAECAWFGDPAFDVAFLLNHLLLKSIHRKASVAEYRAAFDAFLERYAAAAPRPDRDAILARAARLLPGLLLARVDGKSPVEYLTVDADREIARRVSDRLLRQPTDEPARVADRVKDEIRA